MPYHHFENELRVRARSLLAGGELGCEPPVRVWGGYGSGLPCSLCTQPINRDDIEYQIAQHADGQLRISHFHFECHAAWQVECLDEAARMG